MLAHLVAPLAHGADALDRRSAARSRRPVVIALALLALLASAPLSTNDVDAARTVAAPGQNTTMRLEPARIAAVAPGSSFQVKVWLDDPIELSGFQFTLRFDPQVLEAVGVTLGPLLGSTGRDVIEFPVDQGTGYITYGAASLPGRPGPSVSGVIATVTLRAMSEGTSDLTLDDAKMTDTQGTPIVVDAVGGVVTVRSDIFLPAVHQR